MCYYNGIKLKKEEFIRLKSLEKAILQYEFLNKPLQIGFDYSSIPVLKKTDAGPDFEIVEMEWGFLPLYIRTRDEAFKFRMGYKKENGQFQPPILTLNAVGEELLFPNKMFRQSALSRRCLVLSSGFFEWRHTFPANKRTGLPVKTAIKYPYHISLKDREYFYMAAIWTPWKDIKTGQYVETCAIVTTEANELMSQIHNSKKRMPAILPEDLAWEWLFGNPEEERIKTLATYQIPSEEMQACTIAKDFREAIEPSQIFLYEDLPAISF